MSLDTHYLGHDEKLLVIIGPSGAGKTTLVEQLTKERRLELTPSWTTRMERRGGEAVSDHVFTDEATFKKLESEDFFLETVQLFGLPYYYGLPKVGHDDAAAIPVVVLRTMVLPLLSKHYSQVIIYQIEAAREVVARRLQERGGSAEDREKRLSLYHEELSAGRKIADRTFANDGDLEELQAAITTALKADFT